MTTPIYKVITLSPDQMAYYPICGEYVKASSDWSPARGFVDVTTVSNYRAIKKGKEMRMSYRNVGADEHQDWWRASLRVPLFIFYQGKWPATGSISVGVEAYMQIPAYHFTIPSQYSGMTVAGASLSICHYGTILGYGKAGWDYLGTGDKGLYYAAEAPTDLLNADSGWRDKWTQKIGLYGSLSKVINNMHSAATESVTLDTDIVKNDLRRIVKNETYNNAGRYSPVFGNLHATYNDDGIPITHNPWTQNLAMPSGVVSGLNYARGGYVVISPDVSYTTGNEDTANDYPCYTSDQLQRWLCCSFFAQTLTVRLVISQ